MKFFSRAHFCSKHAHARGFTLIEILVSVIILSVGILAVSQMTVMGMRVNTKVNKKMHARAVLAQVFEDLNNLPPEAPELQDPDGNDDLDDTLADFTKTMTDPTAKYVYQVSWNVGDDHPEPDIKTVRIFVRWIPENGVLKTDLYKRM